MKGRAVLHILMLFLVGSIFAQDALPTSTPLRKRGWLGRLLHPFSPEAIPQYKDARLRGLTVDLQITPQSIKLSEVRQLGIKLTLANISKRPVTLDFPTNQRIEIYLMNSEGNILTKWSDNHAIAEKPATILIKPQERNEHNETIESTAHKPNQDIETDV